MSYALALADSASDEASAAESAATQGEINAGIHVIPTDSSMSSAVSSHMSVVPLVLGGLGVIAAAVYVYR